MGKLVQMCWLLIETISSSVMQIHGLVLNVKVHQLYYAKKQSFNSNEKFKIIVM